ncbi:MAG: hypothetical protein ACR2JG_03015 [Geodermatophilaceae bacterium]
MTEHLGHEKHHAPPGGTSGNIRNGTRAKTVLTDAAGAGRDSGAEGPGGNLRAGDRGEAAAAAERRGRGSDLVVCEGVDDRGDFRALR